MIASDEGVVLVTGAASGIGLHIATRYASRGLTVAALDLLPGEGRPAGPSPFRCDVTDGAAVAAVVTTVERTLGPITRLYHCAGICPFGPTLEQDRVDIDAVTRVNYLGTVNVLQAVVTPMVEHGAGRVVVLASIGGIVPITRAAAYSASKAAVLAYCEVLAREVRGSGVTITCVCPPRVETPMLDRVRPSHPEIVGRRPGISTEAVLAAADSAARKGRFLAFPGLGTAWFWRARRYAPGLLTNLIDYALTRRG